MEIYSKSTPTVSPNYKEDPFIQKMLKELYREELMIRHNQTCGGKYLPFSIEPFPLERDRLALPFTEEDRKLRKQWLEDQKLSHREPVANPKWTDKNIFRRIYSVPYDALTKAVTPFIGSSKAPFFRTIVPKVVGLYLFSCFLWYKVKYGQKIWYQGQAGISAGFLRKPTFPPGHPYYVASNEFLVSNVDHGFSKRTCFLGDNLNKSAPDSISSQTSQVDKCIC